MWGRLIFASAAALLALGPALTNVPPRWVRWPLAIGFASWALGFVLMFSLGVEGGFLSGMGSDFDDRPAWQIAVSALVAGGVYLVMFHRSLRGYVLPLFIALAGTMLAVGPLYDLAQRSAGARLAEGTLLESATGMTLALLGVFAGLVILGVLAGRVERGWLSEVSMASAAGLLVIAVVLVWTQYPDADDSSAWLAWLPLGWWAVSLGAYGLALGRHREGAIGPQLLVLRVFVRDRRKNALLDRVQSRWRYLGAVHQIGGPDMVAMNIEPYEGAMLLRGRLHELFLPDAGTPAQLQARLHTGPDCEGRYGVNEVFCFNTAWRATVEQLMHVSDAVLLGSARPDRAAGGDRLRDPPAGRGRPAGARGGCGRRHHRLGARGRPAAQ